MPVSPPGAMFLKRHDQSYRRSLAWRRLDAQTAIHALSPLAHVDHPQAPSRAVAIIDILQVEADPIIADLSDE